MFYSESMARATYTEIQCKSAINRVSGMPFNWSLNPYRGCVHACHYCYARATHAYYGMNADEDFETKILVKTNIAEVLQRELARPSWRFEQIAIGTATDAYQPAEGQYRLTRACLDALLAARNPISVVTKSTLILRDQDLLVRLAAVTEVRIYFTITTLDRRLWRLIEPGSPPPEQRLMAMKRLSAAGVPCGVLMAPILPGITDALSHIDQVAAACKAHGARMFHPAPLRLAPLVREHYLAFVEAAFPDLLPDYLRAYTGQNATPAYIERLNGRIHEVRARYDYLDESRDDRYKVLPRPRVTLAESPSGQLTLPL
jgi:DNA repair photolyase